MRESLSARRVFGLGFVVLVVGLAFPPSSLVAGGFALLLWRDRRRVLAVALGALTLVGAFVTLRGLLRRFADDVLYVHASRARLDAFLDVLSVFVGVVAGIALVCYLLHVDIGGRHRVLTAERPERWRRAAGWATDGALSSLPALLLADAAEAVAVWLVLWPVFVLALRLGCRVAGRSSPGPALVGIARDAERRQVLIAAAHVRRPLAWLAWLPAVGLAMLFTFTTYDMSTRDEAADARTDFRSFLVFHGCRSRGIEDDYCYCVADQLIVRDFVDGYRQYVDLHRIDPTSARPRQLVDAEAACSG